MDLGCISGIYLPSAQIIQLISVTVTVTVTSLAIKALHKKAFLMVILTNLSVLIHS